MFYCLIIALSCVLRTAESQAFLFAGIIEITIIPVRWEARNPPNSCVLGTSESQAFLCAGNLGITIIPVCWNPRNHNNSCVF